MVFRSKFDETRYNEAVLYLKRYNAIDFYSKIYKTLEGEKKKFHYYGNDRSLIDSKCVGRNQEEFVKTNHYRNVTKETLVYNPIVRLEQEKELPIKPLVNKNWFKYFYGNFFTEVVKWIPFIITVIVVAFVLPLLATVIVGHVQYPDIFNAQKEATREMLDAAAASPLMKFLAAVSFRTNTLSSLSFESFCITLSVGFYAVCGYAIAAFLLIFLTAVPLIYAAVKTPGMKKYDAQRQTQYEEKLARVQKENQAIRQRRDVNRQSAIDELIEEDYQFTCKYVQLFRSNYTKYLDLDDFMKDVANRIDVLKFLNDNFVKAHFFHEDYATDVVALSSFVDYFEHGICDHFEGEHGAFERYADEVYRKQVIAHFEKIEQGLENLSDKLDVIIRNQSTLARSVQEVKKSIQDGNERIIESLDSLNYKADDLIQAVKEIPAIYYYDTYIPAD